LYTSIEENNQKHDKLKTLNYYLLKYVFVDYIKNYCENKPKDENTIKWKNFIKELIPNEIFNDFPILETGTINGEMKNKNILALISSII
jgi:hypothetical protein